jgi:hypothetical protein
LIDFAVEWHVARHVVYGRRRKKNRRRPMRYAIVNALSILTLITALSPATAWAECDTELAAIDARLAAGAGGFQQQLLQRLRDAAAALCAQGQEDAAKQMLAQVGSQLDAQSAETAPFDIQAPAAAPASAPASVSTRASVDQGTWFDRPENMNQYWFQDMDRLGNELRILYSTSPSLAQGRGDWTVNVYVAEMSAAGETRQHRLYSKQAMEQVAMALVPDENQILVQQNGEDGSDPSRLEVWSVPDGKVVSSVEIPSLVGSDGRRWEWGGFKTATFDGNAFFASTRFSPGRSGRPSVSTVAWFELTPEGTIVNRGERTLSNARQSVSMSFPARGGGAGFALDVLATDEDGIDDSEPISREVGGRSIQAVFQGEKRLLIARPGASAAELTPALARDLSWVGEVAIPDDLPTAEVIRQNNEQMRLMEATALENGGQRNVDVIKPTEAGYGALVTVTANRRLKPPVHGPYFVEVDEQGQKRETYLNPLAEDLDVKFLDFAAANSGGIYLLGEAENWTEDVGATVVELNRDGTKRRAVPIAVPDRVELDGIVGGTSGAWVVGHGRNTALGKTAPWVRELEL